MLEWGSRTRRASRWFAPSPPRARRGLLYFPRAHHPKEAATGTYRCSVPGLNRRVGAPVPRWMAPVLEHCDRTGERIYLESSKESKHPVLRAPRAFEVTKTSHVPGGPGSCFAMWARPSLTGPQLRSGMAGRRRVHESLSARNQIPRHGARTSTLGGVDGEGDRPTIARVGTRSSRRLLVMAAVRPRAGRGRHGHGDCEVGPRVMIATQ